MKARRPGVSAVLLEEYAAGVSASVSTSMQAASSMLVLLQAALAICVGLALAPKFASVFAVRLALPYPRRVLLAGDCRPFTSYVSPARLQQRKSCTDQLAAVETPS
jgi:hypothetical protein